MILATIPILLWLAGVSAQETLPKPEPFLIVQVVDVLWLPLPGAEVHVRERRGKRTPYKQTTDARGLAQFSFAAPDQGQSYDLAVSLEGFKKTEKKNVVFGVCQGDCDDSHYVQLRMDLAGKVITIR